MIKGLTDTLALRRDGKIRSGTKDNSGKLNNTPYFLLHDAPQLIPALGENPTEIYFTLYTDNLAAVAKHDLRWYSRSELSCVGNGEIAAYSGTSDVAGVRQKPHPIMNKHRERACVYRQCPEYINGMCSEHLFLDMLIPQYSMASMFTLDNSSISGLLNVLSALQKAQIKHSGRVAGQIFRLFKKDAEISFQNPKTGQKSKRLVPVIHMEYVPFAEYEKKFRDKISTDDWESLVALRSRTSIIMTQLGLSGQDAPELLEAPLQQIQLPGPEKSDEEYIRERANDPLVMPLFDELAALLGKPNSEEARYNTAKQEPSVPMLVDKLKGWIFATKKKNAATQAATQAALEKAKETIPQIEAITQPPTQPVGLL